MIIFLYLSTASLLCSNHNHFGEGFFKIQSSKIHTTQTNPVTGQRQPVVQCGSAAFGTGQGHVTFNAIS
jgi:hypothetical protein